MCESSADNRAAVAAALRQARRLVVTTHVRPDGDAIGSMAALHLAARSAGVASRMVLTDQAPQRYDFLLAGRDPAGCGQFAELARDADLVVIVDTCAVQQLESIAAHLPALRGKIAVIDHHATADDIADVVWRDESAGAAAVMVTELMDELGWAMSAEVAEAVAAGVCAETGWLRYANTDSRVLATVARCVEAGVRPDELYARLYQRDRPERLRLTAAALASLELHLAGQVAVMTLTREDFERTGAADNETAELVNEPLRIESVDVSALLVAQADGRTRVSLRSRKLVDVAAVAEEFGGGGHPRAAGFRTDAVPAEAAKRLIDACRAALE
ncbi:MAG TPA: bifunctional oligoribonuclease/PAP phosphatase NrnA [Phycisphaerae bacterium]|nr:bifunctional oligoribonuclease/PAP phosphatase NrnA [Phycisphaerae bacterium]